MSTQKIIPANDFKHGTAMPYVDKSGNSQSIDSDLSYDYIIMSGVIDSRMKLNRYYSGDAAGGSTTVTYGITEGGDDGRWRTSTTFAHDPADNPSWYGDPSTGSSSDYIGFDRY